jgi:hypothetical protein
MEYYEKLMQDMKEINPEALKADGFDDCIIAIIYKFEGAIFLYDVDKMIDKMVKRDSMTPDEAQEYFDFNIVGAYMGEFTPAYLINEDNNGR